LKSTPTNNNKAIKAIKSKMATSTYSCEYCSKTYTRKNAATKHFILCELLHNSINIHNNTTQKKLKREQQCEEEETSGIPSQRQLYIMLQELAFKCSVMETKMENMQKWTDKTKRKLNVLQWLNQQPVPIITYTIWANNIQLLDEDITTLMEENVTYTLIKIVLRNLINLDSKSESEQTNQNQPIRCFNQKSNVFYIYTKSKQDGDKQDGDKQDGDKQDENELNQWHLFTTDQFSMLLHKIRGTMIGKLREWYKKHKQSIINDDNMGVLYSKTVSKLMTINFNQDSQTLSKIKMATYNHLKLDLKKLIEYEFEF